MNLVKVTWMATMINRSESDMGDYYCEKPQLKRIQRLGGFMTDFEDSSWREIFNFFASV